jgi:hypothetical protein
MPVAPTALSFSSGLDEAINEDGFMQPQALQALQAPLDHGTTGVHHYEMGAPTFPDSSENFLESGPTWTTYEENEEDEEGEEKASPRYRRAYGSISPTRLRRDDGGRGPVTPLPPTNTGETTHYQGMDARAEGTASPVSPARTDALVARTDALVGGYSGEWAADARYHPTTTPLGSSYDQLLPTSALKRKRDTVFLMLLTLLVLSIIGIMSCNYLLSMYSA